jgi:predicted Zn-dependent protease
MLLTASSCATTGINRGQINLISSEEEVTLGKNLAAEIDSEQPVVLNNAVATYVSELGKRIAAQTGREDIPFSFKVIDNDEEINAFALPGGPIYVYTGLLKYAENEAELASVLGHEIGHVTARHSTEQLTKAYGIQLLTQIVLGEDPGALATMASNVGGSLGMLKFSRDDEIEADRLGVHYMFRAGYNPDAMLSFQRKLGELEGSNSSKVMNLLSTHPLSQARINAIQQEIATLPPGKDVEFNAERYNRIMGRALR